ncbi:MAG: hypothetical protein HQM10_01505 [Candidatus Riflebacteria bacterium]|nr:hypothetical protein [Candidatus Riflebacteria bacterium]
MKIYNNPVVATGDSGGDFATTLFSPEETATDWGVVVDGTAGTDDMKFFLSDLNGKNTTVTIPADASGSNFRTLTSIINEINSQCTTNGVDIRSEYLDPTHSLKIYSKIPGKDGTVTISDVGNGINTLYGDMGIESKTYQNGVGQYAFTMHVKDAFVQFQIGPNQGHFTKANIIRTDVKALGIEDLNVTNVRVSQEAIFLVDRALQRVSSERSKLGAVQNRMEYTTNSLRVSLENVSASESRIRDVDMAREVVEMTRFQILQQASNSMLAQANATAQKVLDLLR